MKFVNLTPHPIIFLDDEKNIIKMVEPSGQLARVKVTKKDIREIDGIPVKQSSFSNIEGLPEPQEGIIYLVSSLVASRCSERKDVFIPDDSVRDNEGVIIGCRSLGHV